MKNIEIKEKKKKLRAVFNLIGKRNADIFKNSENLSKILSKCNKHSARAVWKI